MGRTSGRASGLLEERRFKLPRAYAIGLKHQRGHFILSGIHSRPKGPSGSKAAWEAVLFDF